MSRKPMKIKEIQAIGDLTLDPRNANKGTERGAVQLENSLRDYGAGRSILVDKHGVVIAGNKTLEQAASLGLEVETVRTDGNKLVVVQREDLDLQADPRARELAIADNRVAQIDLEWDVDELKRELDDGVDLAKFWRDDELAEMLSIETKGPPVLDSSPQLGQMEYRVIVDCRDECQQTELLDRFEKEGLSCRALIS
jgi:hypothetical protein